MKISEQEIEQVEKDHNGVWKWNGIREGFGREVNNTQEWEEKNAKNEGTRVRTLEALVDVLGACKFYGSRSDEDRTMGGTIDREMKGEETMENNREA